MSHGFIAVPRSWAKLTPAQRHIMLELSFRARYNGAIIPDGCKEVLERGQMFFGEKELSEACRLHRNTLRRCIINLILLGQLRDTRRTARGTVASLGDLSIISKIEKSSVHEKDTKRTLTDLRPKTPTEELLVPSTAVLGAVAQIPKRPKNTTPRSGQELTQGTKFWMIYAAEFEQAFGNVPLKNPRVGAECKRVGETLKEAGWDAARLRAALKLFFGNDKEFYRDRNWSVWCFEQAMHELSAVTQKKNPVWLGLEDESA